MRIFRKWCTMRSVENEVKNIYWLGHASFKIKDELTGNLIYYIDPFDFKLSKYEKADIIFVTHAHFDHCSKDDVDKIIKDDTVVVAPRDCIQNLGLTSQYQRQGVSPNENHEVKGLKFRTVPAYNIHPDRLSAHPRSNNWVGFIITVNNQTIYHAGDTDFIPEMKNLGPIDIVMLPMGGKYTMDVEDAIEAANAIGAKITIPMHYKRLLGSAYKEAEEKFQQGVTNSKVFILTELR